MSPGPLPPRQQLERVGIGERVHVALVRTGKTLDRGAVEAHAVLQRVRQLRDRDRHAFQEAQNIREPEPDEPDILVAGRLEHEVAVGFVFQMLHTLAGPNQQKRRDRPVAGPSLRRWSDCSARDKSLRLLWSCTNAIQPYGS